MALEVQTPTNLITSAARGLPLHRIEKLANELEPERVVMRIQRRIDATIDELSALVGQPPTAANEARYDRLMAELQALEEEQAEEMGAVLRQPSTTAGRGWLRRDPRGANSAEKMMLFL